jgi:hypothetical protein
VEITNKYGKLVENYTTFQNGLEGTIMVYFMVLHPRQYSVLGNLNIKNDEENMLGFIWGNYSFGNLRPLFGLRTTNVVEGENYAILLNNLRHQPIFRAFHTFVVRCSLMRQDMDYTLKKLIEERVTVCERAHKLNEIEQGLSHLYTDIKCGSGDGIYNVVYDGTSRTVNLVERTCTRCIERQQLKIPCRYAIAMVLQLSELKRSMEYVHHNGGCTKMYRKSNNCNSYYQSNVTINSCNEN